MLLHSLSTNFSCFHLFGSGGEYIDSSHLYDWESNFITAVPIIKISDGCIERTVSDWEGGGTSISLATSLEKSKEQNKLM